MTTWLAVIGGIISCIIGLWKFLRGRQEYKRKVMDEASKDLDKAHENKDSSSILDAWDKYHRV